MNKTFASFLLAILVVSCADTSTKGMTVSGNIAGLKKGTLFLQKIEDSVLVSLDSLEIKGDGTYAFVHEIDNPEIFYLYLKKADNNDINDRIAFFGEAGDISISTTWNQFESKAKIVGSKSHTVFQEYQGMMTNFNKRDIELAQIALSAGDSINVDSVETLAENNYRNRFRYLLNFAFTNPNSHVTPYIAITDGADANPIYLDSIYNVLPDSIANGKYGKALKSFIERK